MKLTEKIFIYMISLLILFLPLRAEKKPAPIPLEELTDPDSPSYVPYPYPKTEFEIFEDFKYGINLHFGAREGRRRSVLSTNKDEMEDRQQLILGLLGDNPSLKIIDIIKAQDLIVTSRSRYHYFLPIADDKGEVVAIGDLCDSGLFAGVGFYSEKVKFKPFKTEKQAEEILSQALGSIRINKMERIIVHSTISTPGLPIWRISTPTGDFFIGYDENVYYIENEVFWTSKMDFPDADHKKISLIDPLNDKVIFLKRINK